MWLAKKSQGCDNCPALEWTRQIDRLFRAVTEVVGPDQAREILKRYRMEAKKAGWPAPAAATVLAPEN